MSGYVKLDWKGDKIREQLEDATISAMNDVMDDCVQDAKSNHPWASRTGAAEASIQAKAAKSTASKISGRWGSYGGRSVRYFFYLEVGTGKMAARPALRPAADKNYPKLVGLIKRKASL